jgi:amino acid adenylation domain-containing protein
MSESMNGENSTAALDAGEQALWVMQRLVPGRGVSNVAVAIELDFPARWWPLREAANWLVARHPALRTSFPVSAGLPVRRCHPADQVEFEIELTGSTPDAIEADLRDFAARPFDLECPPLVRIGLFLVGTDRSVISLTAHHIVVDAMSLARLVAELGSSYQTAAANSEPPDLPAPTPVPPRKPAEAALRYWRDHVAGFDASGMRLDGAGVPGAVPTFAGEMSERILSARADGCLASLRKRCRTTDAILLLAIYHMALRCHGASSDSVVGVMVDTRGSRAVDAVGYHVATVPLRVRVADDMSVADVVAEVTQATVAGLDHGPVPFEVLAGDLPRTGDDPAWWRTRLVRHLFNFRPGHPGTAPAGGGSRLRDVCTGLSRFDLELTAERVDGVLVLKLLYSTEVHDAAFAERLLDRFELILHQAAADPDSLVGALDLRTGKDQAVQLEANRTGVDWPAPHTVLGLINQAAAAAPDAAAVVEQGRRTTYRRLLAAAWTVRQQVLRYGGGPGAIVAIAAPRGAGAAATVLGIWAAGACYLPIDPAHPARRTVDQLDDVSCRLVFGGEELAEAVRRDRVCLPVPDPATVIGAGEPLPEPQPAETAYVIFTSGSTGMPKGVRLTHTNLANVVRDFAARIGFSQRDGMAWLTTFAFDISALELCLPLAFGGRVVVAADETCARPRQLLDLIEEYDVTTVQATPTTWRMVAPYAAGRLSARTVLCGGEPMPASLGRDLLASGAKVFNVYGPTETTIWSTVAELTEGSAITVGGPIANTWVHVMDECGGLRPIGLTGELVIGGAGVALGYHQQPELTKERFREHPELGRYYRTGDQARWRPDGTLELLGRTDRQVKLRAHRIELGEVEAVLEEHPEVTAAAVVVRGDPSGSGVLVAFVVAAARPGLAGDLWSYASERLPGYCVPGRIEALTALPATANGKVDFSALDALPVGKTAGRTTPNETAALNGDGVEATLVELWRTILRRPSLGPDANFFLSGGHSLLAIRLAEEVSARCGAGVTMGMVFRAPTPATLAALLAREGAR